MANNEQNLAVDLDLLSRVDEWWNGLILSSQRDVPVFARKPLQHQFPVGGIILNSHRDELTIFCRVLSLDDDGVPIMDEGIDHRVSVNTDGVYVS